MITALFRLKYVASGMYTVAVRYPGSENHSTIPGMVIGGNGIWHVQRSGIQWPERYRTARAAAAALAAVGFGI